MRSRYGQLSGMVEPIAGMLGAVAVSVSLSSGPACRVCPSPALSCSAYLMQIAKPLLPYALAFAAGAMVCSRPCTAVADLSS
jgi:zinc transporter ZupT